MSSNPNGDFSGKVALVTGAAAGMGLATARAFAEAGAAVVLADFKEDAVKAAAEGLVAAGHKALAVRCDVSDDAQVAAMVDRAVAEFGRLDRTSPSRRRSTARPSSGRRRAAMSSTGVDVVLLRRAPITRTTARGRLLSMAFALAVSLGHAACGTGGRVVGGTTPERPNGVSNERGNRMKIRMDVEGTEVTATLDDNATSRDFVSLLPLTLTLKDYAETEKVSGLPKRLSTEGAPPGSDPSVGDIAYYAPWGNLAVFYRDFGYSKGLVKLGKIDSGAEALSRPGPLRVTIEIVER